jgi:hypothetical protein
MRMPAQTEPSLIQVSDTLSLRYQKTGEGLPLVLMHTIRTQLEYFRSLHRSSPNRIRFTSSIFLDTVIRRSIRAHASMSPILGAASSD